MIDIALVAAGALLGAHVLSIGLALRKCRKPPSPAPAQARISLVRPVCGLESHIEQTLESSFKQTRENIEIIFCAARRDDAAAPLVMRLMAAHPHVTARLLFGESKISQNPKLNNMAKGWADATGDIVVFADSNLLLPPDYCATIEATFARDNSAIVSAPPVGDFAENFWGEVECAMLNTHAARWQFAAAAIGLDFAQGKTLAFRKNAFAGDLMLALAREPAEDAAATKLAREQGLRLTVLPVGYRHPVGARSARAFWSRHARWARLRRATFPFLFSAEAACGAFPALLALSLSPSLGHAPFAVLAACLFAVWYGAEYALARSLGWRASIWFLPSCIVRDAMLPLFYCAAWTSGRFEWRGNAMDAVKQST